LLLPPPPISPPFPYTTLFRSDGFLGDDRDALEECDVAVGEMTGCRQRLGPGEQEFDALLSGRVLGEQSERTCEPAGGACGRDPGDRKSTRLNSSHDQISYAVF